VAGSLAICPAGAGATRLSAAREIPAQAGLARRGAAQPAKKLAWRTCSGAGAEAQPRPKLGHGPPGGRSGSLAGAQPKHGGGRDKGKARARPSRGGSRGVAQEQREPGRGWDWPSLLPCRPGKARNGPFRPTDANAGLGTAYSGKKKAYSGRNMYMSAGTHQCRPGEEYAGPEVPM
jgi:hypothetical protein